MTSLRVLPRDRAQVLRVAQGYYAETCALTNSTTSGTNTGFMYAMGVGLLAGDVVSNLSMGLNTVGTTVTLARLGLYSKAGVLLASTADQSAAINGTAGMKTFAVTTPYTVPADDLYYLALLVVGGTQPTCLLGRSAVVPQQAIGAAPALTVFQSGLSDLPAPATLAYSSNGKSYWIGVS